MIRAILWLVLMVVWLAGLIFGLWWAWPNFERMALTADLAGAIVWLMIGTVGWLAALRLGWQRYLR